ncbi:hypothetical protein [Actinocorallia sp. A-T 12471]|uniref:hypothetical protein n=1 Tax=Actinocorallia sp. A-T 12471 TaxID=3089813 RepID=UPI0029CAD445|nr:hypothetical protein [Actinocorallia sp. A-T 12471]MDX6744358.1 hypothetical protein [Actinocorallia sp. A-T 12471]
MSRAERRSRLVGSAAVAPLSLASLVLLGDGLGTEVGIPGQVVGYMAATGLLLGMALAPLLLKARHKAGFRHGVALVPGASLLLMALIPEIPVFASFTMVVAACAPTLLALTRGAPGRRAGHAGLVGVGAAVVVAAVFAMDPLNGLGVAGALALAAGVFVPGAPPAPSDSRPVRRMLPAYAAVGWALGAVILPALRLWMFRFELFGSDQILALLAAVAVGCALAWPFGRWVGDVASLLILAAGGLVLTATGPNVVLLGVGVAVTFGASIAALARLDRQTAGRGAALTASFALLGGLLAYGADPLLRSFAGSGTALTLCALPILALALLELRLTPPAEQDGPPLLLWRLSDRDRAVDGVSLAARPGDVLAFYGKGSRALLGLIAGTNPAGGGRLLSDGADLTRLPAARRVDLGLAHRAPVVANGDARTVGERLADVTEPWRARQVLEVFPALAERRDEPVEGLDAMAGLLLGLAEALLREPRVVLVDAQYCEPSLKPVFSGLAAKGAVVVLAEPPAPLAAALGARTHLLKKGRVDAELVAPTEEELTESLDQGRS